MDAAQLAPLDGKVARVLGAAGNQHRVVVTLELFSRHVTANIHVQMEGHALGSHLLYAPLDDIFFHLEVGDAVAEKAARLRVLFIDMYVVASTGELLGGSQTGGAGAYDRHALAGLRLRRLGPHPAFRKGLVSDGAFDGLDGDGNVDDVEGAGGLAGGRTDASRHFWEIVGGMEVLRGLLPIGVVDEVVPVRDLIVYRAVLMTIGNAAIHAAGSLTRHLGVADRDQELTIVTDAVRRRLVGPVLAVDLEEARYLAHLNPSSRALFV